MSKSKEKAVKATVTKKPISKEIESKAKLPTLEELLGAGSHFGHKKSAWNPKMQQYIYSERNGVHIIDLIKTLTLLKKAVVEIEKASDEGQVLLVGTKGQAASLVQKMAQETGAFYINKRWPGGLFTNFKAIKKSVDKLVKMEETLADGAKGMVKKEELLMQRDVDRLNKLYEGIKFMDKLPKLMIVIDSKVEKLAMKEAKLSGVKVVALMDTNCDPSVADFPIPANDDSIRSIELFVKVFGDAIKGGSRSAALISMRLEQTRKLEKLKASSDAEKERVFQMQEQERERMKALREGKEFKTAVVQSSSDVIRVVEDEAGDLSERQASTAIVDSGLPTRTVKALNNAGYESLDQLKEMKKSDLVKIDGVGTKAAEDILKLLK